jgi:hypothetical protein
MKTAERQPRLALPVARLRPVTALDPARRHRVMVMAPTTVELVRGAGGWLCDRMLAGWDATVLTAEHGDPRPLRILGVTPAPWDPVFTDADPLPPASVIAIQAALCGDDTDVRHLVRRVLHRGTADVWLWGMPCPHGGAGSRGAVRHRLSFAARAFKTHALAAAEAPEDSVAAVEIFRHIRL